MTGEIPIAIYWDDKNSRASVIQECTFHQSKLTRDWLETNPLSHTKVIGQLTKGLETQINEKKRHALIVTNRLETDAWYSDARLAAESLGVRIVDRIPAAIACCAYQLRNESAQGEFLVYNFARQGLYIDLVHCDASGHFRVLESNENRKFPELQRQAAARVVRHVLDPKQLEAASRDSLERLYDDLMHPGNDEIEGHLIGDSLFWSKLSASQRDQLMQEAFEAVPEYIETAISKLPCKAKTINRVCVTGELARYKSLRSHLSTSQNRELIFDKPTLAVALGAAKIARRYSVVQHAQTTDSLEVAVVDTNDSNRVTQYTVIPSPSALPATAKMMAQTGSRLQDRILLRIDRVAPSGKRQRLAEIRLGPIRYLRRGYTFEIEFNYGKTGMIEVLTRDKVTGEEQAYHLDGQRNGPPLSV